MHTSIRTYTHTVSQAHTQAPRAHTIHTYIIINTHVYTYP